VTEQGTARVRPGVAGRRLALALAIGVLAGAGAGVLLGLEFAVVVGWLVASGLYLLLTWMAIGRMDAATTKRRATREDPTLFATHLVLIVASLASLGGVALLLVSTGPDRSVLAAALGALSVAASWFTVHTAYTLGYAEAYYSGKEGGIDFNQSEPPSYADFAYVGFTLGMTYQVSDTTITDSGIRRMVLRQSLLSYLLGAVVLAIAINLVGGLAG
jgi:uncharacterized membrane protein